MRRRGTIALFVAAGALAATAAAFFVAGGRAKPPADPSAPIPSASASPSPAPAPAVEPSAPPIRESVKGPAATSRPTEARFDPIDRVAVPPWQRTRSTLTVRVTDPWERPAEEVEVRAVSSDGFRRPLGKGNTKGGVARISLPRGEPLQIAAGGDELYEEAILEPVLAESEEAALVLVAKGARVSGRVIAAESGDTLDRARLSIPTDPETWRRLPAGRRLDRGVFDLTVPAGDLHLVATAPRRAAAEHIGRVRAGEWLRDLDLVMPPPYEASLAGTVTDDMGTPIAGATVRLTQVARFRGASPGSAEVGSPDSASTDGRGSFRFQATGVGEHLLDVEAPGHEPTGPLAVELLEAPNEATVSVARAGTLRVRGVLPDGSPMGVGGISLSREGRSVGEFSFPAKLGKPGVPSPARRFPRARSRAGVRGLSLLEPSGVLQVPGLPVTLDEEGYTRIEGLAWGEYEVRLSAPGCEGSSAATVAPGGAAIVEVRLWETARPAPR